MKTILPQNVKLWLQHVKGNVYPGGCSVVANHWMVHRNHLSLFFIDKFQKARLPENAADLIGDIKEFMPVDGLSYECDPAMGLILLKWERFELDRELIQPFADTLNKIMFNAVRASLQQVHNTHPAFTFDGMKKPTRQAHIKNREGDDFIAMQRLRQSLSDNW